MEPQVRFCTSADGTSIAYSSLGEGPPLIATPLSWQSIQHELDDTYGGPFYAALAQRYRVVIYERRGIGLSDQERTDFTLEADVQDLETVVDHLGLKRFALMGSFHLGPAAIAYTARYPRLVSRLVLYGTYARGREITPDEVKASVLSTIRSHWGIGSRTLADITAPGVEGEMLERIAHIYRASATREMAANLLEMAYNTDVVDLLPNVKVPTLVLHRQGSRAVRFRLARELASLLPSARLVTLEGIIHWPWLGDSDSVIAAIFDFLIEEEQSPNRQRTGEIDVHTILFTDMESSTSMRQQIGDEKAQEIVHVHNSIVRDALKANGGREIKHTGDGIMASFGSASQALQAAVTIQRSVAAHVEEHPDSPLGVYVGLNAGEPIAEGEDLFGTSVDLAARLVDRAEPGQIIASDVVRQLAAGKDFLFADLGETELRGFEDPVKLWELRWQEQS